MKLLLYIWNYLGNSFEYLLYGVAINLSIFTSRKYLQSLEFFVPIVLILSIWLAYYDLTDNGGKKSELLLKFFIPPYYKLLESGKVI